MTLHRRTVGNKNTNCGSIKNSSDQLPADWSCWFLDIEMALGLNGKIRRGLVIVLIQKLKMVLHKLFRTRTLVKQQLPISSYI